MSIRSTIREKLSRSLRWRQTLAICVVIVAVVGFVFAINMISNRLSREIMYCEVEYRQQFLDSVILSLQSRQLHHEYYDTNNAAYNNRKSEVEIPVNLIPFDPNTADSLLLLQLGLKPWQARTLIAYRSTGAKFKKASDMRKLYFMTDSLYSQLEPYISIIPDTTSSQHADSIGRQFAKPLKVDTILELNSADTAQLQLIRSIGRYTAMSIVRYRRQLGGYVDVKQLLEIDNIKADSFITHFVVDTSLVTKIPVNRATVDRLNSHPYISFTQAKELYQMRREHIKLTKDVFIQKQDIFPPDRLEKILPYLDFSD